MKLSQVYDLFLRTKANSKLIKLRDVFLKDLIYDKIKKILRKIFFSFFSFWTLLLIFLNVFLIIDILNLRWFILFKYIIFLHVFGKKLLLVDFFQKISA